MTAEPCAQSDLHAASFETNSEESESQHSVCQNCNPSGVATEDFTAYT
jgi:hypothetical protein